VSQTVSQNHAYLIRRNEIYYFSRRVPSDLQTRFNKERVTISLRTRSFLKAEKSAEALSDRLERYWDGLRLEVFHTKELGLSLVASNSARKTDEFISLDTAVETYLKLKSDGRSQTFFQATSRAMDYLKQSTSVQDIGHLSQRDATAFRDFLIKRGMTSASVRRVFGTVRAITNLTIREYGLGSKNVFADVYLPDDGRADKRPPIPTEVILQIQKECMVIDDEKRWLVLLISDTGMRLAEAVGLLTDDIKLDEEVPYIKLRQHPWRSLKTKGSERDIPLVGASLWAAKRIKSQNNQFAFPGYTSINRCAANSASAALNKWLKPRVSSGCVVHSFRHSLRDRLRAVECPPDIADAIGGWSSSGVGQKYGSGYSLAIQHTYLNRMKGV
jgi:integrase